jgi:HK97 gp10 family phage protein
VSAVAGLTVRDDELGRLAVDIERHVVGMDSKTSLIVRKAAFDVERFAKQNAAVDTGFMRNAIHTEIIANSWKMYGADVISEAAYSIFQEAGTSRMAPHPFMGPAADRVEPGFLAALEAIADPLQQGGG